MICLQTTLTALLFYPSEMLPDGTHFGEEYVDPDFFATCLNILQEKSGELEGLSY